MTTRDRTFERIEALFDIEQFADVRVLIAGCGSGGSAVALQLVMSGIRNFTLLDHDVLGPENEIRHVCGRRFIGQKKVDALAEVLRDRNPHVVVSKIDADLTTYSNLSSEIAHSDVVVLATDNDPTRYMINELCVRNRDLEYMRRLATKESLTFATTCECSWPMSFEALVDHNWERMSSSSRKEE